MPTPHRRLVGHRQWLMAALALCACAEPPSKDTGRTSDLLLRPPSEVVSTVARLTPATFDQWGDLGTTGWNGHTGVDAVDGRAWVQVRDVRAGLILKTVGPVDRELTIVARAGAAATPVQLILNEVPLEVVHFGPEAAALQVEVPAAFWQRGRNVLEIERPAGEEAPDLWVSEVRLSPAESVERTDDGLTLDPGTEVLWQVETPGTGLFDLTLVAATPGEATVTLESLDPADGSIMAVDERLIALTPIASTTERLLLPDGGHGVHQLRVAWNVSTEGSPLTLERLDLYEDLPSERPPILFISIDTLSAANMSVYGYARETTPNLEAFAEEAILFETARANAPWTIPSYASQFTGLYAQSNKNYSSQDGGPGPAWQQYTIHEDRWTLVEMLKAAGYTTAGIVDNLWLTRVPGFAQGFDHFDAEPALLGHEDLDGGMRMVMPRALEFLEDHRDEPAFVFAQVVDVHGPYNPSEEFRGHFGAEIDHAQTTVLPIVRTSPTAFGGIPSTVAQGHVGDEPLPEELGAELVQADYDEKILELDSVLGGFFDDLRAADLYDDLMIVVSADHGESMVDHDFYFRHGIVYDSAIRVPLMVKLPGQAHAGRRIATPVQLVDLYPTLTDLLRLGQGRSYLHGRSLLGAIEGADLPDAPILSQADIMEHCTVSHGRWKLLVGVPQKTAIDTLLTNPRIQQRLHDLAPEPFEAAFGTPPPVNPNHVIERIAEIRDQDPVLYWRLVKSTRGGGPIVELYDTVADPLEQVDLSEERPDVVDELITRMKQERARAEEAHMEAGVERVQVTEAMLEELRRLGYVGQD